MKLSLAVALLINSCAATDENRLSDQIKELSTKLPETKVLENKLTKMVKLEPRIHKTMIRLNKITNIPSSLGSSQSEVKSIIQNINRATDGQIQAQQAASKAKLVVKEIKKEKATNKEANLIKAALKTVVKETKKAQAEGDKKKAENVMKAVAKETAKAKKSGATDSQTAQAVIKAVIKEEAKTDPQAASQVIAEVKNAVDGTGQAICKPG